LKGWTIKYWSDGLRSPSGCPIIIGKPEPAKGSADNRYRMQVLRGCPERRTRTTAQLF
jgi:hypothetical protein